MLDANFVSGSKLHDPVYSVRCRSRRRVSVDVPVSTCPSRLRVYAGRNKCVPFHRDLAFDDAGRNGARLVPAYELLDSEKLANAYLFSLIDLGVDRDVTRATRIEVGGLTCIHVAGAHDVNVKSANIGLEDVSTNDLSSPGNQ